MKEDCFFFPCFFCLRFYPSNSSLGDGFRKCTIIQSKLKIVLHVVQKQSA